MAWRGSGVRVPSAPLTPRSRAAPGAAGSGSLTSGRWHGGGQGFESPQLHPHLEVGLRRAQLVAAPSPPADGMEGVRVRVPSAPLTQGSRGTCPRWRPRSVLLRRMLRRKRDRRQGRGSALDTTLFVFAGLSALWLAYLVLLASFYPGWQLLLLGVFWPLVA